MLVLNLPEWFPAAVFTRKAVVSKRCATQMITEPFEYARKREVKSLLLPPPNDDLRDAGHG